MRDLIYIGEQKLTIVRIIISSLRLKRIYSIKQLWKTMNLVNHFYDIMLDITKKEIYAKSQKKKTRIVNVYNNKLEEG